MKRRLFVSIPIPEPEQKALAAVQERQRYRLRWVEPNQFHLTLCFLGDTDDGLLPYISEALAASAAHERPFALRLERIGPFPPKLSRPNMIWAFFEESDAFEGLAKRVKESLMKADASFMRLAEEWRKDIPHVTLARFTGGEYPKTIPSISLEMSVTGFDLMESVLYPQGPVYNVLESFPFKS